MVKRILALDVGEKRIGVAVSDPMGWTAQGVETIFTHGAEGDVNRIETLLRQYDTDRLVVGLPKSLSGEAGPQAERIMRFAELLLARGWHVRYQDERLTTAQAQRILIEGDVKRAARKQVVDKLAATCILQSFLDAGGWKEASPQRTITDVLIWKGGHLMENNNMETDNIIELVDENDNPVRFEHIMTVQYEGEDYVLLAPAEPIEDMDEDEVLVLRIENDENGEEVYVSLDDDDLVQSVFEQYLAIVEAEEE